MGIWDKIKSAKNYLTGGGLHVELINAEICYLRKPFNVILYIEVEDTDVEVDSIYIHLRNEERVSVPVKTHTANGHGTTKTAHETSLLYEKKILIEQDLILEANERYEFEEEIELPPEAFPSFLGKHAELSWTMRAVIEKAGTNPKSNLIKFDPYYEFK